MRKRNRSSFCKEKPLTSLLAMLFFPILSLPLLSPQSSAPESRFFGEELNFARNRLLEEIGRADQKIDPRELLFKAYQSYPSPIEENVDFIRELEDVVKRQSFIAKEHPEVLADFADIIGGEYTITQDDQLYYTPKGTRLKLTMVESSSAVRSLLDIGFYLRHVVQKGTCLW